jgi:hypothetical protein
MHQQEQFYFLMICIIQEKLAVQNDRKLCKEKARFYMKDKSDQQT